MANGKDTVQAVLQPAVNLNLQPGDLVRVKSHVSILSPQIDTRNTNRGLCFDAEMVPYCGGVYRVITRVERFLDEKTGRMKSLKTPAVILQDVACKSRLQPMPHVSAREGSTAWWREVWLERAEEGGGSLQEMDKAALRLPAEARSRWLSPKPRINRAAKASFKVKDLKEKTIRGGAARLLGQAARALVRLISLIALAHLLDPSDFGLVAMVTVITGAFEIFANGGL